MQTATLHEFLDSLEKLLRSEYISSEAEYRIRKLFQRSVPLADKMFLKTVKGGELLWECRQKALDLPKHVDSGTDDMYRLLTELERAYEELVQRAYEFRVKAG
jgi:hypothetical protein